MKILCAWCYKFMGTKEPLEDTDTTHGMCQDCYAKVIKRKEEAIHELHK